MWQALKEAIQADKLLQQPQSEDQGSYRGSGHWPAYLAYPDSRVVEE